MNSTLTVEKVKGIYQSPGWGIRVGQRWGKVQLSIANAVIEFQTPVAVRAGLALVTHGGSVEEGEFVRLVINGTDLDLLPEVAMKLGGAMLRKASAADDWQISIH